jgi:hypothetical protein
MSIMLLWLMCVPLVLSIASLFVAHRLANGQLSWGQLTLISAGAMLGSCLFLAMTFYLGKSAKTADTEVWNGQVTSKSRVHGTYIESYSCNCHQSCSGSGKNRSCSEHCDTCYRDHWTVNWSCESTLGHFHIDGADWTSPGVYNLPDPPRYTIIKQGDPVSETHNYTNYIKAVPDTLFRPAAASLKERFAKSIPQYPDQIYDLYHIDRVIPVGVNIPNLREWNNKLSDALKTLGPRKQANSVIVITNTNDPNYFYALQDAWLNGKKNDIVVVIGAPDFPHKPEWVRIMALTQHDIFQVKLRDDIMALDELTPDSVIGAIAGETESTFQRKRMRDFAYLDAEIDPPDWVMITALVFIILVYIGAWFMVWRNFSRPSNSFAYNRGRRYR